MGLTDSELLQLNELIAMDKVDVFYRWGVWKALREEVLRMDNYECQLCKAQGRYAKAVVVHHVQHVKDRSDLALSVWDENGERQLISVCKRCHEMLHPESLRQWQPRKAVLTQERWD